MNENNKIINISLIDVIRIIKGDFRKICVYSCTAGVIGVILAFATPKTYKSTVILAPEESGQGFSGSISSLASMVGMNMKIGQSGDALYPEIYPDLMNSTDFIVGLFPVTVTTNKTGERYTYQDYLQHHQKKAFYSYPAILLGSIVKKLSSDPVAPGHKLDPFHLTRDEYDLVLGIQGNLNCTVDKKTNVITIVVEDQDPLIAATIADSVQQHLQLAITSYRTKKARIDLEYMDKLFSEARKQYDDARHKYAASADADQDVLLQRYRMRQNDLENDMQLKYTIYQQVVEQRQLAVAKVQERTPAFTIVQSATVPVKHSNKPKVVVLAIWMFLGFLLRFGMLAWQSRNQFIVERNT